jgi:hypothetical protein
MGAPGVTHTFHFTFGKLFEQSTLRAELGLHVVLELP